MINDNQLDMNELSPVTGGARRGARLYSKNEENVQLMRMECPFCHDIFRADVSKASIKCPTCHKLITISG
jgi:hypothetical protein